MGNAQARDDETGRRGRRRPMVPGPRHDTLVRLGLFANKPTEEGYTARRSEHQRLRVFGKMSAAVRLAILQRTRLSIVRCKRIITKHVTATFQLVVNVLVFGGIHIFKVH